MCVALFSVIIAPSLISRFRLSGPLANLIFHTKIALKFHSSLKTSVWSASNSIYLSAFSGQCPGFSREGWSCRPSRGTSPLYCCTYVGVYHRRLIRLARCGPLHQSAVSRELRNFAIVTADVQGGAELLSLRKG